MTRRIEKPSPIGNRAQRRAYKAATKGVYTEEEMAAIIRGRQTGTTLCPYTEAEIERSQETLEKLFGFREE